MKKTTVQRLALVLVLVLCMGLFSTNMNSTYMKHTEFFQNLSPDSPIDAEPFQ